MHISIVLNLSQWNIAEFVHCVTTNVLLLYASLLLDLIAFYQGQVQNLGAAPETIT